MPEQVLYGIKLLAQASPRPMRAEPRWTWTNESGDDCDGGQVYLVAGGWGSGGSTDSTETLVEGEPVVATTLRNFFQTTERLQKIKMSPTTPLSVAEELLYEDVLDGIPDGSPGLTKNFFERVPFLPDSIT